MSSYKPVTNVLDFNVALKPSKAFPLDPRTMFGSYEEALAAAATAEDAGSDKTIYYFGQTVTVYENGIAKSYLIQPDDSGKGTLVEQSAGGGDMQASVYDPKGRAQDVFAYIDKMVNVSESIAFVVYIDLVSNTADTSLDSIFDEINLNKSIYAKIENDDEVKYTLFPLVSYSGGGFVDGTSYPAEAKFSAVFSDDAQGTAYTRVITLTEGDDLAHPDVSVADYPQAEGLPAVTASDNGKLLQVVDGAWSAVTITDGNEVAW